ncbi:MAG: cellulase family glycosylhydrolase [Ketobacteraceae bacterium]|nr:cellulase family glycosylhydrolase [Ketobacteraceae bacterium]
MITRIGLAAALAICLAACGGGNGSAGATSASDPRNNSGDDSSEHIPTDPDPSGPLFGLSYPPVEEAADRQFTLEQLAALNVDRVRFDEGWRYREPEQGFFDWGPLDQRMDWLFENGISVLLTIQSNGPDWACDPVRLNERACVFVDSQAFKNYIQALLQRYPNEIPLIQFGNEWLSDYWFTGNAEEFVEYTNILYSAVQEYSPQTKVVLGGLANGDLSSLAFCKGAIDSFHRDATGELIQASQRAALCNSEEALAARDMLETVLENAKYDVIDIHLYDDVENWKTYLQTLRSHIGTATPVIVGEFGGPNLFWEAYSDEYQAQRLEQYLTTLSEMAVEEAYYFKLVQSESALESHWESGLFRMLDNLYVKKPAFDTFQQFMLQ